MFCCQQGDLYAVLAYVLQAGKIVQSGTYQELMEREGLFRDLASRQIA